MEETVSETTLMEESETRRDVDRAAAGIARDEGRQETLLPPNVAYVTSDAERYRAYIGRCRPQLRQEVTKHN